MSPHFLTRCLSRLLGLDLVSWAFACVGVHRPSLRLPHLGVFYSLFFTSHWVSFVYFSRWRNLHPHQPFSLFQTWIWHYCIWISEKVEIPWWWSIYSLCVYSFYYIKPHRLTNRNFA